MKHKTLIAICLLTITLIAACVSIPTKDNPPAYTKAFVQDAIRLYNRDGRQALTDHYNSPESIDGQWYMFIIDEDNIMFVHPEPELVGTNLLTIVDSTGYKSGEAISTTTEQGQWFTYSGHNYETGQQARKHAWAIRHDGLIFGSGWHETGATRSADDPVTASEVTDRATLKAFVEDVRVYLESITTVTGIARLRDFFRTEGRYKSGSIFLMAMTQSGNIVIHGHDPTSENKNIAGVKDELDQPVGAELLAAAQQGGGFVDYRWDGIVRTAYAIPFTASLSGNDLVLVGGFAQDLTSVPVKFTPLPRPEVTAAEVVDRQTLATFVEAAMKEYRDATLSPNLNGLGNTKIVFRQEGGYWKSGSVYVFVISTDGYTLFHGGFPLRFEGRQFEDIDREDINGVRYLRELLAAGEAGGGFVEYMFDNPAIEGDEETGSRKIAYATGFRIPGRDQLFVVASGFYPDE